MRLSMPQKLEIGRALVELGVVTVEAGYPVRFHRGSEAEMTRSRELAVSYKKCRPVEGGRVVKVCGAPSDASKIVCLEKRTNGWFCA